MTLTFFRRFRLVYDLTRPVFDCSPLPAPYQLASWMRHPENGTQYSVPPLAVDHWIEWHARAKFASFRHELDANVFPCLGDLDGCRQLMREIATRTGFTAAATWLLIWRRPESAHSGGTSGLEWEPVGTIQGIANGNLTGTIQNIGVAPEHRGQGLGKQLIRRALLGFQDAGMQRAVLEVTSHNTRACRLYERLGFQFQRVVYKYQDVGA